METFVINELMKLRAAADLEVDLYHFRGQTNGRSTASSRHQTVASSVSRSKPRRQ